MTKKKDKFLEFLLNYGWAFLVIIIMVGTLAYFGVLNPYNILPEPLRTNSWCGDNPDKCVCEEWKNKTRLMFVFNKVRMAERNVSFDDLNYIAYLDIAGYYICPAPKEIPKFQDCFAYEILENKDCIKSRPKTECEKGNPNWIKEKVCLGSWYQNKETEICCLNNDDSKCSSFNVNTICREK